MSKKTASRHFSMQKASDVYARFLTHWAWILPAVVGLLGLASAVTTQVFLPLWGGISIFAALGMFTLVFIGKTRIRAGWIAATVLTPFIGQVGIMSFVLLLLAAAVYTSLFVIYGLLAIIAKVSRRKAQPASVVSA